MGKKGREIVTMDVSEVVKDLTTAYCDEWMAHYSFQLAANLVSGPYSQEYRETLEKQAKGELEHANMLANRIIELGGEPPRQLSEVIKKAACPPFKMPQNTSDIRGLIDAVLEVERHAIGFYNALQAKTRTEDVVTHELIEEILADEVREEEEWENLM